MQSCELVMFVSSVACTIAKNTSTEELAIIAAVFNQLGDTLTTILTNEAFDNQEQNNTKPQNFAQDSVQETTPD